MKDASIPKSAFDFLKTLKKNNNRDWFNAHKDRYLIEHEHLIAFADELLQKMNQHDHIETPSGKKSLFRIYKDVRFSKDKTPYNEHWSGRFSRATKKLRGGYYYHIKPGNSFVAGGFWGPNPEDLKRIREDIAFNHQEWRKVLSNKKFVKVFGSLRGVQVSTSPKGYSKDHEAIDLLRYKQFIIKHSFTDKEVLSKDFCGLVNEAFKDMRPFFDHMSEVLTTDNNGVSLV